MKKRYLGKVTVAAMMAAVLLTACGSSAGSASYAVKEEAAADNWAVPEEPLYMAEAAAESADYDGAEMKSASTNGGEAETPEVQDTARKLITTKNLSVETEELDPLVTLLTQKVEALGGYVQSSNVQHAKKNSNKNGTADLTLRVPAKNLNALVETVEAQSNITNESTDVSDVTLDYVDTQAHKEALESEKKSLLGLMDRADNMEDIMAIQTRLTDVQYQLNSIESQLRTYDNLISYSTVYLSIREVSKYTPAVPKTVSERIASGFGESLGSVAEGFVEFFVWFVTHIPQLVVLAAFCLVAFLIIRKVLRGSGKKTKAKPEQTEPAPKDEKHD